MIYVENKTKYITVALVILAILFVASFVYQQKTIVDLKNRIGQSRTSEEEKKNNPSTVKGVQKVVTDTVKELKGTIISKTGNILKIEAEMVDFSKLSGLTEEELHQNIASFPKMKKNFEVLINDKTQFMSSKVEDLSEGTMVMVESDEPVYRNDRVTALKIFITASLSESMSAEMSIENQIKQMNYIVGSIQEIGDRYFIIKTTQIDLSQVSDFSKVDARTSPRIDKDYKVFINDKTKFVDKKRNEFKVGDGPIHVLSTAPVYSVSEFTATKIEKSDCGSK